MIIKVKQSLKDLIDGPKHEPLLDDPSRRDFMKRGIYASGLFVMGPAMLSLLRPDKAIAAAFESAYREVGASYCLYEASGGAGFTSIAAPSTKDGKPIFDVRELGWAPGATEDSTLISGLSLNAQDEFHKTLLAGGAYEGLENQTKAALVIPAVLREILTKHVSGTTIACQTGDDNDQNKFLNLHLIQKMRAGSVMKSLSLGANPRSPNAVFEVASEPAKGFSGTPANDIRQLIGAVKAPQYTAAPNPSITDRISRTVAKLSAIQSGRDFQGSVGKTTFDEKFSESLKSNSPKFDQEYGKKLFDITNVDFRGKSPFGEQLLLPALITSMDESGNRERGYIASLSACHRQLASSMYVERGGYDYHPNNNPNLGHRMHAELARFVILWLMSAHAEGKASMLMFVSDGSISWGVGNTDKGMRHVALGDRGTFSTPLVFFYHPVSKVETNPVGHFDKVGNGYSAAKSSAVGRDPRMIGFSGALMFAKFSGLIKNPSDRAFKDLAQNGGITLTDAELVSLCGVA